MGLKIPKVMIAAVKSGSGKTTITCAFLKQLLCRKKHPVSFKCGPDYKNSIQKSGYIFFGCITNTGIV